MRAPGRNPTHSTGATASRSALRDSADTFSATSPTAAVAVRWSILGVLQRPTRGAQGGVAFPAPSRERARAPRPSVLGRVWSSSNAIQPPSELPTTCAVSKPAASRSRSTASTSATETGVSAISARRRGRPGSRQAHRGSVRVPRAPAPGEAVAQTNAVLDFSCARDRVTISGRTFSVAANPRRPPETLSRGRRDRPLCNWYKRFGLCNGLRAMQRRQAP
jgi:hypothetical protein